ncbi:hypothetical protein Vadar_004167 [Vaccinium darrowii]|uniref:Uncharacterized protein n=1 Tax=Vaccinium darrowii TaxID=229202 RepID=A0ACB7Y6E8_9ERIC|nr:hypothetical protein Vadar_004167 [Vaccinium darrowii]
MKYPYGIDFKERLPSSSTGRFSNGYTIADYLVVFHEFSMAWWNKRGEAFLLPASILHHNTARFWPGTKKSSVGVWGTKYCTCTISTQLSLADLFFSCPLEGMTTFSMDERYLFLFQDQWQEEEYTDELVTQFTFYLEIELAVYKFTEKFEEAEVLLADSYKLSAQIMEDPSKFGFKVIDSPCCGDWAPDKNMYQCKEDETEFCNDRKRYLFFDGAHTTDEANRVFVESCLSGLACYRPLMRGLS